MSRRNRTSWIPTGRSISRSLRSAKSGARPRSWPGPRTASGLELLRQLDAIAVRVVDVEQAHDALRDLDDSADLDAFLPEALGLAFHVVDVDMRDCAVGLGIAFGEADLHRAVPEMRPAFGEVDGDLLETERLAIERARRIELPDVVPDGRRHLARGPGPDLRGTA